MRVKEIIELMLKQDPEKEVLIQQGEDHDYMLAHSVREKELTDMDEAEELIEAVVIEYS